VILVAGDVLGLLTVDHQVLARSSVAACCSAAVHSATE
jgi:hypothetical protein